MYLYYVFFGWIFLVLFVQVYFKCGRALKVNFVFNFAHVPMRLLFVCVYIYIFCLIVTLIA